MDIKRAEYHAVTDAQALDAFQLVGPLLPNLHCPCAAFGAGCMCLHPPVQLVDTCCAFSRTSSMMSSCSICVRLASQLCEMFLVCLVLMAQVSFALCAGLTARGHHSRPGDLACLCLSGCVVPHAARRHHRRHQLQRPRRQGRQHRHGPPRPHQGDPQLGVPLRVPVHKCVALQFIRMNRGQAGLLLKPSIKAGQAQFYQVTYQVSY